MCQETRRNSPAVIPCRPASSCMRTARKIDASSMVRNSGADISPFLNRSRASNSSGGRSRLPTWSARNGGLLFIMDVLEYFSQPRKYFARVAFEDLAAVAVAQGQGIYIALRIVEIIPGLRIDSPHRAHHFRAEDDVVGGNHLEQQLDAGQMIDAGVEEHIFQQINGEQRALPIPGKSAVPSPVGRPRPPPVPDDES